MVEPAEGEDPLIRYWYARVLEIFHAEVTVNKTPHRRIDFLWVRWFGRDTEAGFGWKPKRLERLRFLPATKEGFGFLDPATVIRACHIIPAFHHGREHTPLASSSPYIYAEGDWVYHYLNRYVL